MTRSLPDALALLHLTRTHAKLTVSEVTEIASGTAAATEIAIEPIVTAAAAAMVTAAMVTVVMVTVVAMVTVAVREAILEEAETVVAIVLVTADATATEMAAMLTGAAMAMVAVMGTAEATETAGRRGTETVGAMKTAVEEELERHVGIVLAFQERSRLCVSREQASTDRAFPCWHRRGDCRRILLSVAGSLS